MKRYNIRLFCSFLIAVKVFSMIPSNPSKYGEARGETSSSLKSTRPLIEAVIFDLDGTLLDTEGLSDEAMLFSLFNLTRENVSRDEDLLLPLPLKQSILGMRGSEWSPLVLDYYKEKEDLQYKMNNLSATELCKQWDKRLIELCADVRECPGATELVSYLSNSNVAMAIATSSQKHSVSIKKKKHEQNIFNHMSVIVCGDDLELKRGKPAPDIYNLAAKRLGVLPRNCLVFEDAMAGIISAKTAGCQVVAVPDPRMNKEEFMKNADVVTSLQSFRLEEHFKLAKVQ